MYSDQTGKFPVTSYKGNQYIMVLFETTSNDILVEAMKSRTAGEMVQAYQFWGGFKPGSASASAKFASNNFPHAWNFAPQ